MPAVIVQDMESDQERWMRLAITLAVENIELGRGGPFGAVVVKNGELIASGVNLVTSQNDPTAHAEIVAIREACRALGVFQLDGCEIYTSCEPCPMCLSAIYWSRPLHYYFACTREDAAKAGFDDAYIYNQLTVAPEQRSIPGYCLLPGAGLKPLVAWAKITNKIPY